MAGLETIFLGSITARILHGVSAEQAGWLVQALLRWVLDKEEPAAEDIPPEYLGSWIAIHDESVNIASVRKHRQYAGLLGAQATNEKTGKTAKSGKGSAKGGKDAAKGGKESAKPDTEAAKAGFARVRIDRDREEEVYRFGSTDPNPKRAGARGGFAASASASASDSVDSSINFFVIPDSELVPAALKLVHEENSARMKGRLGKFRRMFGAKALREELTTFAAELAAGEIPANLGATLNARLSALETVGSLPPVAGGEGGGA